MNQIKLKRIGSQIAQELSTICAQEAHDSLLKAITITSVEVTNDLGLAKVYFTTLDDTASIEGVNLMLFSFKKESKKFLVLEGLFCVINLYFFNSCNEYVLFVSR